MVITMLQAEVAEDNARELADSFDAGSESLPPAIRETFLLHESGSNRWGIVSVWESKEALDAYRATIETPGGVLMFRSAGAEPTLTFFEVAAHSDHA